MSTHPERPLVSVIIPCFNARPWIEATLASVEAQTWRPLEIVVVDDGSTDGCGEWLVAQAAAGRTRLLRQANAGQPAAINAGLSMARGEYLQFLDADDLLDPEKVERQMALLNGRTDAVATCEWGRFYNDDPESARFVPEACWHHMEPREWLAAAWQDGGGMLFPALWLVPRELANSAGPWNSEVSGRNPDGEYFVRVLTRASQVFFAAGARVRYRSGIAGSMSAATGMLILARQLESLVLIEAHIGDWIQDEAIRRGLSFVYQRFAYGNYPYSADLAERALTRARALSPERLPQEGGWRYRTLSALLGWRIARRLQVWSGRR